MVAKLNYLIAYSFILGLVLDLSRSVVAGTFLDGVWFYLVFLWVELTVNLWPLDAWTRASI